MGNWGSWLAAACLTTGLATGLTVVAATPALAADDYPWAGRGQCPIVPPEPVEEPAQEPAAGPDGPGAVGTPAPPPPPPVLDPVSGHLYDPRGPRPTCARHVWAIDGSIGDPRGFALRNCTSFVAWRLAERNGLSTFSHHFGGQHWGDAGQWDDAARRLGIRVDGIPAIGAVAQTDDGRVGHVAWVSAIGPGTVTIEEYNYGQAGAYGTRTVPVGDFRYLHVADLEPSPLIGSDRPVVAVADRLGESWTARVDDRGTLRVARPGRPARTVGPRRAFSPGVAPALALDRSGVPWLAATTRRGRVLVGAVRTGGTRLRDVATSAVTASPALTIPAEGAPVLATTSPVGTLTTRVHTRAHGWGRPRRVGRPASWATHVAPVLGSDDHGRALLVAVGRRGATYALTLGRGRLVPLPGVRSSITSTPALTATGTGPTYLHQVTAAGTIRVLRLSGRRWSRLGTLEGAWSPYASPVVGEVAGALVLAATDESGTVRVRAAVPGERSGLRWPARSAGAPTRSPAMVVRRNAGTFVVTDGGRARARLLTRPASALAGRTAPRRAGFTP